MSGSGKSATPFISRMKRAGYITVLAMFLAASVLAMFAAAARANTNAQTLPFSQNWTDSSIISSNDDWSLVPGIVGYSQNVGGNGNHLNPAGILEDRSDTVDVTADLPTLTSSLAGGVAEYRGDSNPTIVFRGSAQNDSPNLVISLDTSGKSGVRVAYDLRDLDAVNNVPQQVALQYRVGSSGSYTNVGDGYVADATEILANKVTAVSAALPENAYDKPLVQVRIMTSDANDSGTPGNDTDEWVGIDNIAVTGTNIVAPNAAPVNTVPAAQTTNEDTNIVFSSANGNAISTSDADGDISAKATLGVDSGKLTLSGTSGLSVTENGTGSVELTGKISEINAALSGIEYSPNSDYSGADELTFSVSDQGNTGTGGAKSDTDKVGITIRPVNDAPVARDDPSGGGSYGVAEDGTLEVSDGTEDILANDTDVEGTNLSVADSDVSDDDIDPVNGVDHGSLTLNANGSFTYTPDDDFNGTDTFTYKATDGAAESNVATVNITVSSVNDAPVANDDGADTPVSLDEDDSGAIDVLANDTDADNEGNTNAGLEVVAASISTPENGTATLIDSGEDEGNILYTPNENFNGSDTFTYKVSDGIDESNTATVNVTVNAKADAPAADDESAETTEDTSVDIDVLEGDTDADGDDLTVGIFDAGSANGGTITKNNDGTLRYTPKADYNGTDSFTYSATDGENQSQPATVTVNVLPVNDAPNVEIGGDQKVDEDSPEQTVEEFVTSTSPGPEDESEQNVAVDTTSDNSNLFTETGQPTIAENGDLTYTPKPDANGTATVNVVVTDDGGTENGGDDTGDEKTFTITVEPVNDRPVAENGSGTAEEGGETVTVDLAELVSDVETSDENLEYGISTGPEQGTASIEGSTLSYIPDADYNGDPVEVGYTVVDRGDPDDCGTPEDDCDGTQSASGKVTFAITPTNDAPKAEDDSAQTLEDNTVEIDVLENDTDADADSPGINLVSQPGKGTAQVVEGKVLYTPNPNTNGTDTFTYEATDGTTESNTATVTIVIDAINDKPVAGDDSISTDEDTSKTINVFEGDDPLASDIEVEREEQGATLIVSGKTDGENGSVIIGEGGDITYTPDADFNGEDTFTYTVEDDGRETATGSISVTINPLGDAPVAVEDTATTNEETSVDIDVLENDTDADGGDKLEISEITQPEDGSGTVTLDDNDTPDDPTDDFLVFTPKLDFSGESSFTYTVTDGTTGKTATVTVTVMAVNDKPQAADDSYEVDEDDTLTADGLGSNPEGVLDNDTDKEGSVTTRLVDNVDSGELTFNANSGTFTYTPDDDFAGTDTFTYTVSDGTEDGNTATVSIRVNPVNDKPIPQDDLRSTPENTPLVFEANILASNDSAGPGENGQTLTVTGVGNASSGTVEISEEGEITYTPATNFNGSATFEYTVCDSGQPQKCAINEATVNVTISPVNLAPVADDEELSTNEDENLTFDLAELASDVETPDADLTYAIVSGPENGKGEASLDGSSLKYNPARNFNGTATITYSVTDKGDGEAEQESDEGTLTITVGAVNDAPVAVEDTATTNEDNAVEIDVLENDTDADDDSLGINLASQPGKGTAQVVGGKVLYTPNPNTNGTDTFTYKATDGTTGSNTATVTVGINAINDAPRAKNDPTDGAYAVNEDEILTVNVQNGVLANDTDDDGDTLEAVEVSEPSNGIVTLAADGSFVYTPNSNFDGDDSFTYKAKDGSSESSVATVNIRVVPVADVSVARADSATTREDTNKVIDVLANDDLSSGGGSLTVQIAQQPAAGKASVNLSNGVVYKPNANYSGSDSFTYRICDASGTCSAPATVSVTITPVNDAPNARDDSTRTVKNRAVNVNVLSNDTDADGDALAVASVTQPNNGRVAINTSGTLKVTPAQNFTGNLTFRYRVEDGKGGVDAATVTVKVTRN